MKRPISLLLFLIGVVFAVHAQTSQSAMSYDTLGNRTQRVITPPAPSKGEGQKRGEAGFVPRKYIPSDYEMADIREFIPVRHKKAGKDTDSDDPKIDTSKVALRTDANLPVAAIPYQATVTPSGGRVYSVPIRTAAGFDFVPQISLTYNSQGGPGTAGWGWEISGLSSITLRGKTLYYDGVKAPVTRVDSLAVYAIDGIPLVPNGNPEMVADYPLESAQGHIQVRKNADGTFTALRPDGSLAVYGVANDTRPRVEWPLCYTNDAKGNIIYCMYDYYGNENTISAIFYGYGAGTAGAAGRIEFHYAYRSDSLSRYVAGLDVHKTRILKNVLSFDRADTMCVYSLTHNVVDGVSRTQSLDFWSHGQRINPLLFAPRDTVTYRDFDLLDYMDLPDDIALSDLPITYKRGKLMPGSFSDGIIAHETYPNYAPNYPNNYWSYYPEDLEIMSLPVNDRNNSYMFSIQADKGFQTIEPVDIDGDGADELVQINYDTYCNSGGVRIRLDTYDYYGSFNYTYHSTYLTIPGSYSQSGSYVPYNHVFLFGDFSGRGKTELLVFSYSDDLEHATVNGKYALIKNLDSTPVVESTGTFPYILDLYTIKGLFNMDLDADGRSELCYDDGYGLRTYHYNHLTGVLTFDKMVPGLQSWAFDYGHYITDLNADGYPDVVVSPEGGPVGSDEWTILSFTGTQFEQSTAYICDVPEDEGVQFIFMDVNRDGYPDLVRVEGYDTYVHLNINGQIQDESDCFQTSLMIDEDRRIVPVNRSNYRGACQFAISDSGTLYFYRYDDPAPPKHQIRTFYDSYGSTYIDYHADLSEHNVCSLDPNRVYNTSAGFFRETMPLQVLEASLAYMPNGAPATYSSLVSHDLYRYKDPVINNRGLGFCGFGETKVIHHATSNAATGFVDFTRTVYDPEKRGVAIEQHSPGSAVFNTYDNHTDVHGYLAPRLTQSIARDSLNATVTTTNVWSYDRFDLPNSSSVSYTRPVYDDTNEEWDFTQTENPQWRDSITTTYAHKFSSQKFAIGLPTDTRQIRIHPTKGQWTKRTTVQYDTTGTGAMFLPLEIKEYTGVNGDQLVSTTTRTYSPPNFSGGFPGGRLLTEQTAPYNATTYTGKTYTYSSDTSFPGRYLETETDPLGRTTTYSNYDYFGNPRTVTDHKNRSTTYTYDIWGNLTSKTDIDGTVTTISKTWASENGERPAAKNALIKTTTSVPGHPTAITYTDALGREVKSGEMRMDGKYMYVSTEYDKRGNISRRSLPYKTTYDSQVLWNTYTYDDYGRQTMYQEASGIRSTVSYPTAIRADGPGQPSVQSQLSAQSRNTATGASADQWQTGVTTVKEGVSSTKAYDVAGGLIQAKDAGGTIHYSYRPDGQLDTLYAPGGYLTVFTYDSFGRRTSITDPSVGTRTSSEVWAADGTCTRTETNDKGSITTAYDVYGRETSVTRTGPGAFNTTYTYNTDGFLSASTSTNGTSQEYTYDEYDRPRAERFYAPDNRAFVRVSNYASSTDGGRLSSYQYVSLGSNLYTETIRYANGCYTGVGAGNNPEINITAENDLGLPTSMSTNIFDIRYYSYDIYGRQTERTVTGLSLSPGLGRDTLQRFTYQYSSTAHNITERRERVNDTRELFVYDNLDRLKGDIRTRTTYDSLGNIRSIDFKSQQYGDPIHPYQQTGGVVDGAFNRNQQIVYTAYDRPYTIREGNRVATFTYNDSHQRVKMQMCDTLGVVIYTRYYLGDCWELDVVGTTTTERLYVGGDYYSAPLVKERKKTGNNRPIINTYSLCRDIIGSVTYIPNGNNPYEYSYTIWGRSRDPEDLTPDAFGTDPGFRFHRGFGGHEYLPEFDLYNCNARLYDPLYGRFLSPDPYVQAPDFTQNLNRYSYALNNPMKYTDESGEFLTWRISQGRISIGVNFSWLGIPWGIGLTYAINSKHIGLYSEVGYRWGGTGFGVGVAAQEIIEWDPKTRRAYSISSAYAEAAIAFLHASIQVDYEVELSRGAQGKLTTAISAEAGITQYLQASTSFTYSYDFASETSSARLKAGIGAKYSIEENSKHPFDISLDGSLKGNLTWEKTKNNDWGLKKSESGLMFSFSATGTIQTSKKNNDIISLLRSNPKNSTWSLKPNAAKLTTGRIPIFPNGGSFDANAYLLKKYDKEEQELNNRMKL